MAMHTRTSSRMRAPACSLPSRIFPDFSGDPPAARLTLLGAVTEAPAAEVRDLYLSRHENAKLWIPKTPSGLKMQVLLRS
jgi:hypothetical protein